MCGEALLRENDDAKTGVQWNLRPEMVAAQLLTKDFQLLETIACDKGSSSLSPTATGVNASCT